jgi:cell division protein FtsA
MKKRQANFVSIDVGSSKIASIASKISKGGEAEIIGQNLYYSEGVKSSVVVDLAKAEHSIIQSIFALEQDCSGNIEEAVISLSGYGTKSYYLENKIAINGTQITKNDVQKLTQKTLSGFSIKDSQIIHYFPLEFSIDSGDAVDDPIGMFSNKLGCRIHIIIANSNMLLNLANCFSKCHIEIQGVVLGIYASGMACLTEDEKKLGSLIIDFGARTTSFAIYIDSKMVYRGHVPIGGWHITSDIAKAFSINFATAEKLKILYGSASESATKSSNVISLDDGEGNGFNITIGDLANIISPRIEEILELVKLDYDKVNLDHLISRKIVLTGGGALLKGLKEKVCMEFAKQVRVAKPKILNGFAEDYNPGIYSNAIGVIEAYSSRLKKNSDITNQDYGIRQSWGAKILSWLRENI